MKTTIELQLLNSLSISSSGSFNKWVRYKFLLFFFFLSFFLTANLFAHQLKENYLSVDYNSTTKKLHLTFEIETRIFEQNSKLDESKNGIVSFKELRHHKALLLKYVYKHITLRYKDKKLSLKDAKVTFHRYQVQTYMQIDKTYTNIDISELKLYYSMFFEKENTHKLLINIKNLHKQIILDANNQEYSFDESFMTQKQRFLTFIVEGIKHILDGTDHILFLSMLILPIVIQNASLKSLIIIATSFSLAHSITLFIAGMNIYQPNTMIIESGIALSIFIVALLNFLGKYKHVNYKIAFLFGLLHGFGFANVLHIAGVDSTYSFIVALLGFNVGVEFGQILIIAVSYPALLFLNRVSFHQKIYQFFIVLALIISAFWFFQRINWI
jgi:hypothetical protein